jgi:hypothetical protein
MFKPAIVLAAALAVAGCAPLPQSRQEFQQLVRSGASLTQTDSFVARRSLEEVMRSLRPRLADCFDYDVAWRRTQGGATVGASRENWRSNLRPVDRNHAEATVQRVVGGAVQKQPEGGIYVMAVDLDRVDAASTKLTFYGSSNGFGSSSWESLKQWSEGRAAPCPSGIV